MALGSTMMEKKETEMMKRSQACHHCSLGVCNGGKKMTAMNSTSLLL
jgi:hypothetical protein